MDAVINLVNLFFGAQIGTILGASDALTVLRCACGGDYGVACELMDEQWGEGHAAHKLAQDLVPDHELLSASIEALNGAQRALEVEGGWEAIDEVVRRYLVPAYEEMVALWGPERASERGGYYSGNGINAAHELTRRALSAVTDAQAVAPIVLGGILRVYDARQGVWVRLQRPEEGAAAQLQGLFRELVRARLVVYRMTVKVKGAEGQKEIPQWRVADINDKRWDAVTYRSTEWTVPVARQIGSEAGTWIKDGLHLADCTVRLAQDERGVWEVVAEERGPGHNALFCLPFTGAQVQGASAPRFEALLDNLTSGYAAAGWQREAKFAIKRWLALAFLGAGALKLEVPLLAITGASGGGKSTLLKTIQELLSSEAVSTTSLKSILVGDAAPAHREALLGKLLNIDTELTSQMLEGGEVFKQLVSGEAVQMWSMGRARYSAPLSCLLITAGQNTPRFRDLDTATLRRIVHVHVDPQLATDYRKGAPIPDYHKVLAREEGAGILASCLAALRDGLAQGLPVTQVIRQDSEWLMAQQRELRAESNQAVEFWEEVICEGPRPSNVQAQAMGLAVLYEVFLKWHADTRGGKSTPQSKRQFNRSLADAGVDIYTKGKNHYFPTATITPAWARKLGLRPGDVRFGAEGIAEVDAWGA